MATCQRVVNKALQTDHTKVQGQTYVIKHGELRSKSEVWRLVLFQRPVPDSQSSYRLNKMNVDAYLTLYRS